MLKDVEIEAAEFFYSSKDTITLLGEGNVHLLSQQSDMETHVPPYNIHI